MQSRVFLHATNSAVLLSMMQTKSFELIDLDHLLYHHGVAPMAGEIKQGGVIGAIAKAETAFAALGEDTRWGMDTLMSNYAGIVWRSEYHQQEALDASLDEFLAENFSLIKVLTVELLRHLQMGDMASISPEQQDKIIAFITQNRSNIVKHLNVNYAAAKYYHLSPKIDYFESVKISDFLNELWKEMPVNFLAMKEQEQKEFCQNHAPQPLSVIIRPSSDAIQKIKYPGDLSQVFIVPEDNLYINRVVGVDPTQAQNFTLLASEFQNAIKALDKSCDLLINIVTGKHNVVQLDKSANWLAKPFPVIFVTGDHAGLRPSGYEYRASRFLKVGSDITTVAVPSDKIEEVKAFFKANAIDVNVIDLETLKKAAKNDAEITSKITLGFLTKPTLQPDQASPAVKKPNGSP